MGINLLELITDQIGGDSTLGMISGFLGEDKGNTGNALTSMLPSLLGGLMSKSSTSSGAGQIFDAITNNGFDGTMLGKLGDVFGGGDISNGVMERGGGLLDMVFGNKLGGIVDLISSRSGIGRSSSSSLLKLGLPLIMSFLGKMKNDRNLDASGLAGLLASQKDHIAKAAPAGLSDILGFADFGKEEVKETFSQTRETVQETKREVESTVRRSEPEEPKGGGILGKLLPLLLLLLGGFLLWKFMGDGCMDKTKDAAANVKDKTEQVAGKAADGARGAANATGNAIRSGANKVGDAAKGAANATKDAAGNIVDGAKGAATATGNAAKNAASATKDAAGKVVDGAKDAANAAGAAVAGASADMKNFFSASKPGAEFEAKGLTFNDKELTAAGTAEIGKIAAMMKANPDMKIVIEAFADSGKPAIDKITGKIRAEKIENQFKKLGVAVNRIRAIGKTGANKVIIKQR